MTIANWFRGVAILASLGAVSGCASLPAAGPNGHDIISRSAAYLPASQKTAANYYVVDLTENVLQYFDGVGLPILDADFGGTSRPAPSLTVGVGDVLQVTIFESAPGGLFIPSDAGSRPGNFITLPQQTVDSTGTITVPYAGPIGVKGQTVGDIQAAIVKRLADRAIEPQVIVSLVTSRANQVSVLGDVKTPGRFDISADGERLLDVISRAGGISGPPVETVVALERKGKTSLVLFSDLLDSPKENLYLYPGDTVFLNRVRRTFLAFGASGLNGRIDFDEASLSLAEGVAKAGGLLDNRADPGQVFLYRRVPNSVVAKLGLAPGNAETVPMVFRVNLRDPATLFLAQRFKMQDKDILYIDNASSVDVVKFVSLLNSVEGATLGAAADVKTITR